MVGVVVSVIMCAYNTPKGYLVDAVESILMQTFKDFELIIVDDGSLEEIDYNWFHNDPRIKILRNDTNMGISYSRNKALRSSKGNYIAIMDSDDISLPTRLEKQVAFMDKNPDVAVCGTWFQFFGEKKTVVSRVIDDNDFYRVCLLFGNSPTIIDPSTIIRKSYIDLIKFEYDENLRVALDYLMWVKLSQVGRVTNLKEVLFKYRVHEKQITRNKDIDKVLSNWEVIKYQLTKLGITDLEHYKKFFNEPLSNTAISLEEYRSFLNSLVFLNSKSHFFNQKQLKIKIEKQWKLKILNTKNVKSLIAGCKALPQFKSEIIKTFFRHFNPFLKDKTD